MIDAGANKPDSSSGRNSKKPRTSHVLVVPRERQDPERASSVVAQSNL